MYRDAGYGENWQRTANNARRIDPYTRSCAILGCFFAVGLFLIIVVVLSLIPLYLSHNSSPTTTVQVSKVYINGYRLQFQSPSNNINSQRILSELNNRQTLQAALTSMIQKDSSIAGSIIEINPTSSSSNPSGRKRRQMSNTQNITLDMNITSSRPCASSTCLSQFHFRIINLLTNINQTTPMVRYQSSDLTEIYWLTYRLPQKCHSNTSFVNVDLKSMSTELNTLITIDKTLNLPSFEHLISSTPTLIS